MRSILPKGTEFFVHCVLISYALKIGNKHLIKGIGQGQYYYQIPSCDQCQCYSFDPIC